MRPLFKRDDADIHNGDDPCGTVATKRTSCVLDPCTLTRTMTYVARAMLPAGLLSRVATLDTGGGFTVLLSHGHGVVVDIIGGGVEDVIGC